MFDRTGDRGARQPRQAGTHGTRYVAMPGPFDRSKPERVREKPSPFWWLGWVPAIVLAVLFLQLLYVAGRVAIVPVLASLALAYLAQPTGRTDSRRAALSRTVASLAALLVVGLAGFVFLVFVIPDLWEEVVVAAQGLMSHFTEDSARPAPCHAPALLPPSSTGSSASASSSSCEIPPSSSAFPPRGSRARSPASSPPPLRRSTCCLSRSSSSTFWRVSAAGGARSRI